MTHLLLHPFKNLRHKYSFSSKSAAKVLLFFDSCKYFRKKVRKKCILQEKRHPYECRLRLTRPAVGELSIIFHQTNRAAVAAIVATRGSDTATCKVQEVRKIALAIALRTWPIATIRLRGHRSTIAAPTSWQKDSTRLFHNLPFLRTIRIMSIIIPLRYKRQSQAKYFLPEE